MRLVRGLPRERSRWRNSRRSVANEGAMHRETVDLLGRCSDSSEKSPFSLDLPKIHRTSTAGQGSKQTCDSTGSVRRDSKSRSMYPTDILVKIEMD
jgi:hypothetical protein